MTAPFPPRPAGALAAAVFAELAHAAARPADAPAGHVLRGAAARAAAAVAFAPLDALAPPPARLGASAPAPDARRAEADALRAEADVLRAEAADLRDALAAAQADAERARADAHADADAFRAAAADEANALRAALDALRLEAQADAAALARVAEAHVRALEGGLVEVAVSVAEAVLGAPLSDAQQAAAASALAEAVDALAGEALRVRLHPVDLLRLEEGGLAAALAEAHPALAWHPDDALAPGEWTVDSPEAAVHHLRGPLLARLRERLALPTAADADLDDTGLADMGLADSAAPLPAAP